MMNTFPVPFRVVATVFVTSMLVMIGVLNLRDRAAWVDPTDGVYWVETSQGLLARTVTPGPGEEAGLISGDRLVAIGDHPVSNLGEYSNAVYALGANEQTKYVVLRGGQFKNLNVQLAAKALLSRKDVFRTLLAFLHLGIGLFVVIRGLRQPRAFHFYAICIAAFVVYLYSWTPNLSAFDWLVYGLSVFGFLVLPMLFVHFCLRFPVDRMEGQSRAPLLYIPVAVLSVVQALWLTGHLASVGLPRTAHSNEFLDRVHLAYFAIGFLAGGLILLKRRSEARDLVTLQQMKWVSYGTLFAIVPFSLIYIVPTSLGIQPSLGMESSQLFLGIIPLSFGYAIIRYRLLDVEAIVRRSAAYFISSSLLLVLYLFFVLVVGRGLQWIVPDADFAIVCFGALVVALVFAPLRTAIQVRLDRFFYRDHFEDRAGFLEFARTLSSEISLAPLSRSILARVYRTFQLDQAALFLADPIHTGFFRMTDKVGNNGTCPDRLFRAEEIVREGNDPGSLNGTGENRLHTAGPALLDEGLYFVEELKLRGKSIGMVALGRLPKGHHFTSEDLDLLAALSGYAAIALENANLYSSVESKANELQRLKVYTENIIESINVAVLALDLDGRITSCNRAFEALYSARRHQITGMQVESLFAQDVLSSVRKATGKDDWDLSSATNIFKIYLENRKGEKLIVNLSLIPLRDSSGMNSGALIVMDDLTAKLRLEDQLMQAEKLSSIGLLAAGIAHEVNTPITGISSYTQMLLKQTPETDQRKPILEKIEKQTFRAAEIVNGLLNFSRLNGSEFKDLDVNKLIEESVSLLEHQMRQNHVSVQTDFDRTLPLVYGNTGKLQQVFVNLFLNARDAMPSGGKLEIKTCMNETMVIVDVSDTGVGISEEDIKRIYDPFFTTKNTGKGTGLGLAVTYGIIQEHGGRIFVDSTAGRGTHFRLKLPTRQLEKQ